MKKVIFLFFTIAISLSIFAKEDVNLPKDENGKVIYTEVVEIENTTKDILYGRGLEWFARIFKSAQVVIQMQDKEAGKIVGKALIPVTAKRIMRYTAGVMNYTISLYFKDNKYKYEISDFIHDSKPGDLDGAGVGPIENSPKAFKSNVSKGEWNQILKQVDDNIKELIANLKEFMSKESVKKDDW